jgi:hypothetical protein
MAIQSIRRHAAIRNLSLPLFLLSAVCIAQTPTPILTSQGTYGNGAWAELNGEAVFITADHVSSGGLKAAVPWTGVNNRPGGNDTTIYRTGRAAPKTAEFPHVSTAKPPVGATVYIVGKRYQGPVVRIPATVSGYTSAGSMQLATNSLSYAPAGLSGSKVENAAGEYVGNFDSGHVSRSTGLPTLYLNGVDKQGRVALGNRFYAQSVVAKGVGENRFSSCAKPASSRISADSSEWAALVAKSEQAEEKKRMDQLMPPGRTPEQARATAALLRDSADQLEKRARELGPSDPSSQAMRSMAAVHRRAAALADARND